MAAQPSKVVLALETSGRQGGVAILRDDALLSQAQIPPGERTTAALAPLIKQQLRQAGVDFSDIALVAVTAGPGSFTGLRVGVTTAKTLGYVLRCDVLGVDTLAVIAEQAPRQLSRVWAVLDAQRQQLFTACFARNDAGQMVVEQPTSINDREPFLQSLSAGDFVSGPGVCRVQDIIGSGVHHVEQELWQPQAETVGRLAQRLHDAGQRDDFWKLAPNYYRRSAAEEKLET